jgi:hypothetical protein
MTETALVLPQLIDHIHRLADELDGWRVRLERGGELSQPEHSALNAALTGLGLRAEALDAARAAVQIRAGRRRRPYPRDRTRTPKEKADGG